MLQRFAILTVMLAFAGVAQATELPVATSPQYNVYLDTDKVMVDARDPAHLDTIQFAIRIAFKTPQQAAGKTFTTGLSVAEGRCSTLETAEITSIMFNGEQQVVSTPVVDQSNLKWLRLDDTNPGTHTLKELCRTIETPCAALRGDQYKKCRADAVTALRNTPIR